MAATSLYSPHLTQGLILPEGLFLYYTILYIFIVRSESLTGWATFHLTHMLFLPEQCTGPFPRVQRPSLCTLGIKLMSRLQLSNLQSTKNGLCGRSSGACLSSALVENKCKPGCEIVPWLRMTWLGDWTEECLGSVFHLNWFLLWVCNRALKNRCIALVPEVWG